MANFFDQFDEAPKTGNFFDQFDEKPPAKKSTIGSELVRGGKQLVSSIRTGAGALTGSPEEAAIAGVARGQAIGEEAGEGASFEAVKKAYQDKGLLSAAGEVASQIPRALAGQVPQLAAMAGSAKLGAMAGTAVAPGPGTVIGGVLGAGASLLPQFFGANVERQASEQMAKDQAVQIDRGAAGAAAAGQAAIESAGTAFVLGKRIVKGVLGVADDAALATAKAQQSMTKAAERSLAAAAGRGAAKGVVTEIPVEIAQSVLERAQAGLDVTSPEALAEYGEVAYQAGLVGGSMGVGAGPVDTAMARQGVKARTAFEEAEVKRKAEAEQARLDAEAAEKAKIPPLALGSEGVFTPVSLPDGSVAMTREDLAQYEEQQFQKKYAAQEADKKEQEVLALGDQGVFRPTPLPDGSVAMTREDLAAYEEQQFRQKYEPQKIEQPPAPEPYVKPPSISGTKPDALLGERADPLAGAVTTRREAAEPASEIPLTDDYAFLQREKQRLLQQDQTPDTKKLLGRIDERIGEVLKRDIERQRADAEAAKTSVFAQKELPPVESRDVVVGSEELAKLQAPERLPETTVDRKERQSLARLEKMRELPAPPESDADKKIAELEKERGKIKSENLYNQLIGKLAWKEVNDISPDIGKNLRIKGGRGGAELADMVSDGMLDNFLPPDKRPGSITFDEQEATEYIKDKLRNKDHLTFDASIQARQLDDQIGNMRKEAEAPRMAEYEISEVEPGEAASVERSATEQEVGDATDIRYQRSTTGGKSIGKQQTQSVVDAVKSQWANAPEVVVAENMDDPAIPEAVRAHNKEAIAKGAKGSPKGFFYKGKAYILADSMTSASDAIETLFHESLGHYGLRGTFGAEMGKVLADVVKNRRADVEAKAKQYGLDINSEKDMLEAAEEVLAEMAQTKPGLPFVKRAIAVIRNFLRDLGLPFKMSNEDIIQKYILPARAFVEKGESKQVEGVASASRAQGIRTGFYSQLQRSIADVPDRIANQPAQQWKAWLASNAPKLGIKKEEIEWSGINDYLDLRGKEKVTKDDLQSYLKDNGVKVSEVFLGGDATKSDLTARQVSEMSDSELRNLPGSDYFEPKDWLIFRDGDNFVGQLNGSANNPEEAVSNFREEASAEGYEGVLAEGESKYGRYTLPGGENYREVLITLPSKNPVAGVSPVQAARILYNKEYAQLSPDQQADVKEKISDEKSPSPYLSSHWSEPNVVAHVRVNDRTDADGNRVLFVEEIQSDWGQKGKSEGFKGSIDAALKANNMTRKEFDLMPPEDQQFAIDETRRMSLPSAAPFITKTEGWLNLALKRIAMMAVEGGYDKVAFINGAQSHARFPKKANGESTEESFKAFYDQIVPQEINKLLPKLGGSSLDMVKFASGEKKPIPPKSEIVSVLTQYGRGNLSNDEVRDELGVDVSDIELEEVDLSDPYDRGRGMGVIRDLAAEIIARNAAQKKMKQPGFDVTPSMRETVGAGVPMFRRDSITGKPILAQWTTPTDTKIAGDINKDDIIYSLQNKMIDTKRVVDAISATAGKIAAKWNPYLQEELYHGRTAKQTKDFLTEELRPLMQAMEKAGVNIADMEEYLKNRHAIDYNAQVAKVNPKMPDKGSGIATADAQAYLNGLSPADKTKYEALAKRVDQITKGTRKLLVDSGLETQETINNWEKTFPFYVPLKRGDIDYAYTAGGMGTGQGFDVRGDFSRRAMGSEREATDVLANIAMMRERAIVKSQKNRVAQALFGLAAQNPNPQFWLPVDPMAEVDPANMQELLNFGLSQQDLDFIAKEPRQKAIDKNRNEVVERINATLRGNENVLSMRFNGQDRYVFFNPNDPRSQRMAKSMKNLDADQLGSILGPLSTVTRWMAAVNTQYNPIFGAYNFLRDVQGAALQLSDTPLAKDKKAVVGGTLPALKGIYAAMRAERSGSQATGPWSVLWEEFQQEGGQTGFRDQFSRSQERAEALQKELNKITEGKAKAAGRAVFDWLSDYNDSMENAVRLSAYKAALDKGIDKQEAASIAKNLTVNFNRKGQIGVQAGALYAFFNAAVQGTTRLAQTLKGPAGKKIIAGGLLLGTMQAALLAAAGFDEEEPPEFVRERNLIIPIGGDKYVAFPMPLGYHVIPGTSRIITEWALSGFKDTPERIASLTGMYLEAFNPIGNAGWSAQTLAPTFADPIVALTENKDWTGKPIARKDFSNLDPTPGYTRSKEATSVVFKEIAKFLNFASGGTDFKPGVLSPTPDQLEYLVGQATGGIGRELSKAATTIEKTITGEDLPSYKIPLAGRFYGETKSSAAESGRFYKNMEKLNKHENEIKGRRESKQPLGDYLKDNPEARLAPMARKVYQDVRELRKRREALIGRDAPKESVQAVEKLITRRMQMLNDRVRTLEESN